MMYYPRASAKQLSQRSVRIVRYFGFWLPFTFESSGQPHEQLLEPLRNRDLESRLRFR